jgi:hypothetical protein
VPAESTGAFRQKGSQRGSYALGGRFGVTGTAPEGIAMMTMGAVTARLKACNRQQCARKAYDASCLALRDGALTGACYLQRDAAKLYAEAQAYTKLADEP